MMRYVVKGIRCRIPAFAGMTAVKMGMTAMKTGMMKVYAGFFLCLLMFLLGGAFPARAEGNAVYDRIMASNTIKCAYYIWPPFIDKDVNTKKMSGLAYDLFEDIGKQLSLKIEWVAEVDGGTMFEGYKNGKYDMICAPLSATPARVRVSDFTIPFRYAVYNLYAREGDTRFDNHFEKINDPKVKYASLDGDMNAILGRELFPLSQKVDVQQIGANVDVFLQVAMGKADVTAMEPVAALGFMKHNPGKIRQVFGGPVRTMPLNFSIPPGEEKLKAMLNTTLQVLLDTGAVDRILKSYPEYDQTMLKIAPTYSLPSGGK